MLNQIEVNLKTNPKWNKLHQKLKPTLNGSQAKFTVRTSARKPTDNPYQSP